MTDEALASFRASIDNIDAALVHLLAERFKVTQAVGRHKATVGLPPADPAREAEQITRLRALAEQAGLDPVFTERFLRFIVDEVIRHHRHLAARPAPSPGVAPASGVAGDGPGAATDDAPVGARAGDRTGGDAGSPR